MKICCVFNYNPLYRYPIYQAMSNAFDCDFYFGDSVFEPLRQFEPYELNGFKKYLHSKKCIKGFIWFSGIKPVFSRKYSHYILTGDPNYLVNWLILLYASVFHKKVYCWCHGLKGVKTRRIVAQMQRKFFNSMDGIFMYNSYNIRFMQQAGIISPLYVIHNSLNTPVQSALYEKMQSSDIYRKHFGNDNPVAIFIGRVQKRMKVQDLIDALDLLKKRNVNVNAVIVGDYIDGVDIRDLVNRKSLENQVWIYGASYDENVNSELLYNAFACIAPGTVGLTAIHSLSYGTPCITHDNHSVTGPEFESIIPGVTGDFFKEDDVENLASVMEKWVNLSFECRDEIRRNCRGEVEKNWSISSQINLLKSVLR